MDHLLGWARSGSQAAEACCDQTQAPVPPCSGSPGSRLSPLETCVETSLPNAARCPRNVVQLGTAVDRGECAPAAPAYDANMPFTRIQKVLSLPSMCAEEPPLGFSVEPHPHPGLSTFLCQVPREPAALAFLALASGERAPASVSLNSALYPWGCPHPSFPSFQDQWRVPRAC